ncbi:MAG: condensation domain-containing protein [Solirubrobacteraceae bacterium]
MTLAGRRGRASGAGAAHATPPTRPMPAGETEELIAELWARVLDREGVGREQDFFELGGDSLAAAEVAVGIDKAFGVQVGMQAFARRPTVAGLAELAMRLRGTGERESPLRHAPEGTPQPASFAQERIWRHCQVPEEAPGWVIAASATLDGSLDVEILRTGLERLLRRHPAAMRTRFPEREGRVLQVIDPPSALELPVYDLSANADPLEEAFALLRELALEPFDLERGPLLRLSLVRLGEEEHLLFRVCHHITCAAPSWRIFLTELGALYEAELRGEAPPLAEELPFTYGDVAAWQRERMQPGGPSTALCSIAGVGSRPSGPPRRRSGDRPQPWASRRATA